MVLKIKRVRPGAHIPGRATAGSAGMDLRACCEDTTIPPGGRALIPTGIAIELPGPEYVALVFARSGLATKRGLTMANGVGVIDSDYRGEVMVALLNTGDEAAYIAPGERVAQLLVMPVCIPDMVELDELGETDRGAGGFGSTGVR